MNVGFKRHFRVETRKGVGAFLVGEDGVTALRGAHIDAIAELLDGTRDIDGLLRDLPDEIDPNYAAGLVDRLADAGLVAFRDVDQISSDDPSLGYWDACDLTAPSRVLHTAQVGVAQVGGCTAAESTVAALTAAGLDAVPVAGTAPVGQLTIVLCDRYLDLGLSTVDAAHREAGVPWLLVKPEGRTVWIGPVFQPPESACWHCLAARLWQHRRAEWCVQVELGMTGPVPIPPVSIPVLSSTVSHLVALEATKWLAGYRHPSQHGILTLDSLDLQGQRHQLRKRPQCPSCGDAGMVAARAHRPVELTGARKVTGVGGGHRTHTPDQVLAQYEHLISPITGVVKEISQDRRGPALLNSFRSGPNVAGAASGIGRLRRSLRGHSGGKGVTPTEARVGALGEAVERYSATFHGDEAMVNASQHALGKEAVAPADCQLFAQRQYAERELWNRRHGLFQRVPERFDPDRVVPWTPVWSMRDKCHRYLPTALLYFGMPTEMCAGLCSDSNGNAAGSSLADAVLQGALELVERDSVALWWYNRTAAPAVDLSAFGDPWLEDVRATYAGMSRELWVLDVTADLNIPAMVAVSRRVDGDREEILFGCGAHLDPRIALRRALSELNQLMPALIDGRVDQFEDPDARWWWEHATLANQPYLLPDPGQWTRTPLDYQWQHSDDIVVDVEHVVDLLAERGMDMLVLEQTRPDIGLPVVKVIVPGLRHFWARFAPGRLFDVPVRLGRVAEPTPYDELNPIPFFL